jgi:hypothetical protein
MQILWQVINHLTDQDFLKKAMHSIAFLHIQRDFLCKIKRYNLPYFRPQFHL